MTTASKKAKRNMTVSELSRHFNVARKTVDQCIARHGVKEVSPGKYDRVDVAEARKRGAEMDKAKKASQLRPLVGSLQDTKLQRQIDKLTVEVKQARVSLARELEQLADVTEISSRVIAMFSGMSQKMEAWHQSETTKHPEMRASLDAAARSMKQAIREAIEDVSDW